MTNEQKRKNIFTHVKYEVRSTSTNLFLRKRYIISLEIE